MGPLKWFVKNGLDKRFNLCYNIYEMRDRIRLLAKLNPGMVHCLYCKHYIKGKVSYCTKHNGFTPKVPLLKVPYDRYGDTTVCEDWR